MNRLVYFLLICSFLGNAYLLFSENGSPAGNGIVNSDSITPHTDGFIKNKEKDSVDVVRPTSRSFLEMVDVLSGSTSISKTYALTETGKKYIEDIRLGHKSPTLIPKEKFSEGLCAGYLYELTANMRGSDAPQFIGMQHPETKTPADAWELPYAYRYRGGNIAHEISPEIGRQFKKNPYEYSKLVSPQRIEDFFVSAFSPASLFGDIGFLYAQTAYAHMLGAYDNFNSHIGKNFGISRFNIIIKNENKNILEVLQDSLGCEDTLRSHHIPVLLHYQWYINDVPVRLRYDGVFVSKSGDQIIELRQLDVLGYDDIIIAHFFEGAHADSLLQMSCQGVFYPINVLQINPSFLETAY